LVADPVLAAAELATQMADEMRRLEALRYDDGSGVSAPSVAAAFELSYRQLDEDAARLFRLPAAPGPDVSTEAATELAGWPASQTRAAIGRLARAHLVEPGGARGRWRMHDLLRLYALQVPGDAPDEREQAVDRLLSWYLRQAAAADEHLRALAGQPAPAEFTGRDSALAWLDAHRPNLIAAVTVAAAAGRHQEAMDLPLNLGTYLLWRRRFDDWLTAISVSRDSARQLDDKGKEARALDNLGVALQQVRRFDEAIRAHQDAVAICREAGDRPGEGRALNHLGTALREVRRFEDAVDCYQRGIVVCREAGDRYGEGQTLDNLARIYREMGHHDRAAACCQEAAAAMRDAADRDETARPDQTAANTPPGQRS
jgi:tetratricopeptide (TPR) repeat protein